MASMTLRPKDDEEGLNANPSNNQQRKKGWEPTVIIHGKPFARIGPLQASEGEKALFSQLYILDPRHADEASERFKTMALPPSTSSAEKEHLRDLLALLQYEVRQCNSYVKDFKFVCEQLEQQEEEHHTQPPEARLFLDETKRPHGEHQRRFNNDFNEITVLFNDEKEGNRWLQLSRRGTGNKKEDLHQIKDTHRSADPLHFVLLFPRGTDGWHLDFPKTPNAQLREPKLTPREYYAFHVQMRCPPAQFCDSLFRGGRLFQEYLCVGQAKVENQRLKYIRQNQQQLRGETYKRLAEDVHNHRNNEDGGTLRTGQQVILPPSFTGSPRYMHAHRQDALAVIRKTRKPDFFSTFTFNPNCREMKNLLLPGQKASERPDLIARVFHMQMKQFHKDINEFQIFGKRIAHMGVNEYQKRGLPHEHSLTSVCEECRMRTADDVDDVICAELPPDPNSFPPGPEKQQAQRLQNLVTGLMIHTCSQKCREGSGRCQKGFPKAYCEQTQWEENAFYPQYRRRSPAQGGRSIRKVYGNTERVITNADVVPYSPFLLLRYESHINVEACISPSAAKYLFKYVTKGPDRAMAKMEYDEVSSYQSLRSIGSIEASWRLLEFKITERYPAVYALRVHLENNNYIVYEEGQEAEIVAGGPKTTELTGFFSYNVEFPGTKVKYIDFPEYFTWSGKKWTARKRKVGTIGRIHTIHPNSGDVFYLRMLLTKDESKGATSFQYLRTLKDGTVCETYKEACQKLGYLQDDNEFHEVLDEAFTTMLPKQCRVLFCNILLYNSPADPLKLFDSHYQEWEEDFRRRPGNENASDKVIKSMVLLHIEELLHENGKKLEDFNLPDVSVEVQEEIMQLEAEDEERSLPVLFREELDFDFHTERNCCMTQVDQMNDKQKAVFDFVMDAVEKSEGKGVFIDARGGTGKTFTLDTMLCGIRSMNEEKCIALAVASSGIAALLLPLGRTFHSRFKAPLKIDENMTLSIRATDTLAKLIRESKAIIWDESPMSHRYLLEALDRTLQDILRNNQPFGGKVMVLAGDFRQVLPVVPHGSRAQIVDAALCRSHLWSHFKCFTLTENLRLGEDPDPDQKAYDEWMLGVGDGDEPIKEEPDKIAIPERFLFEINDDSYQEIQESKQPFIDIIFPDMANESQKVTDDWIDWIGGRAILCPRNAPADELNHLIFNQFPGDPFVRYSADMTTDPEDATRFPVEYLNSITPAGLPPHMLFLKEKMILLLMRNLCKSEGLQNGTRLIVISVKHYLLHCKIATGPKKGNDCLIPRIDMEPKDGDFPFKWKRRQYPVRPAFAMTINKSQGQSLGTVGAWLEEPVFSHGQLYVSLSRIGNPDKMHIAIKKSHNKMTRNVVYKEVFQNLKRDPRST